MTCTIRWTAGLLILILGAAGCDLFTSPETRIERAAERIEAGEYRAAVFELRKVLDDDPGQARARLLLAQAEYGSGDMQAAEADLDRALQSGAEAEPAARLKARLQLAFGRHQVLLTQLDAGEIVLPQSETMLFQGRARLGLGQPDEALQSFESALRLSPGLSEAKIGIAEAKAASGNVSAALEDLAAITAADPTESLAWLVRGGLLLQLGRAEEGDEALGHALEHAKGRIVDAQQMQALAGQVDARISLNQFDQAEAQFEQLEKRVPDAPITRLLKARLALAQGNLEAGIAELTSLTNDLPGLVPARFMLGSALLAQGNLHQAERQLAIVIEKEPANLEARRRLAEIRLRMNRPEAAMELLSAAPGGAIDDPRAIALLGAAQLGAGSDPSAIAALEQAVGRNPADRASRLDLAGLYITAGNAGRAVELLRETPVVKDDARREFLLIRAINQSGGESRARAEVDLMVNDGPADVERLNVAAGFYLSFGDVRAATATLEKAHAVKPNHVPTLINLGRARLAVDQIDAAEALLRRALSHEADNVDARIGMAEIAGRRGDSDGAIRWLEGIRMSDARAVASRLMLARLYLSDNESAKASRVLAEAIAAGPNRTDVLIAAGRLQQDFGKHEQALAYYRKAADLVPQVADHWLHLASAQAALGYLPAAHESSERALTLEPDSVEAVRIAGQLDAADGNAGRALERALDLRKRLPGNADAALLEGDTRSALGQHAQAARAYGESLQLKRTLPTAVRLTQARQLSGLADPRAPLRNWLRDHPDDLPARSMHAIFLDQAGLADQAISEYERVLADGRPDAVMSNNLAVRYLERGDSRAESLARQAYRLAPTNAAIADTLGWILVKKGSRDEGLRLLREAVAQAPEEPEIQLHLAEALVADGKTAEARAILGKLLAPDRKFAGRERAEKLLRSAGG